MDLSWQHQVEQQRAALAVIRRNKATHDSVGQRIVHSDGRALVEHFWGRYVAFLPSWTGDARVLRDPTGTLPCYRIDIDGVSIVLSWLEDLYSLLNLPMPSVDWNAVSAHMILGQVSGRQTLLDGVSRILPGDLTCWRRSKFDPPCRLNFDPGLGAGIG